MKCNQFSETPAQNGKAEIILARDISRIIARTERKEQPRLREHPGEGAVPASSPSLCVSHLLRNEVPL